MQFILQVQCVCVCVCVCIIIINELLMCVGWGVVGTMNLIIKLIQDVVRGQVLGCV